MWAPGRFFKADRTRPTGGGSLLCRGAPFASAHSRAEPRWRLTEIKVQRKAGPRKKWPWLLLLLIPIVWLVLTKGGAPGDDGTDASDSAKAKPAAAGAAAPRTDSARKDSARARPDTAKPPV